jgi:hypothetical protein
MMVKRKNKGKSPLNIAYIRLTMQKLEGFRFASIHSLQIDESAMLQDVEDFDAKADRCELSSRSDPNFCSPDPEDSPIFEHLNK